KASAVPHQSITVNQCEAPSFAFAASLLHTRLRMKPIPRSVLIAGGIWILMLQAFAVQTRKGTAPGPADEISFIAADTIIGHEIGSESITGAVFVVGHNGRIVHAKAFGSRILTPKPVHMTLDTVFDLASLTK